MTSILYKGLRYICIHKQLPGLKNLRYRHRQKMPLPPQLQIEPTTRCNLNCSSCNHGDLPASRCNQSMSFDFFCELVEQIPSVKRIKLQGLGEPLMTPDLGQMLEWGWQRGIDYDMIVNGTLVKRCIDDVLPFMSRFVISFDAATNELATQLRSRLNLDTVKESVMCLVETKRRMKSSCLVGITCVVSHCNFHEIKEIMEFGVQAGVDYVGFVAVENWKVANEKGYRESAEFVLKARKVVDIIQIQDIYNEGNYTFSLGLQDFKPRKGDCQWGFLNAYVTCDGYVTPCCLRTNPDVLSFGNLHSTSFNEIWNSSVFREFRKSHLENLRYPVCDTCPL